MWGEGGVGVNTYVVVPFFRLFYFLVTNYVVFYLQRWQNDEKQCGDSKEFGGHYCSHLGTILLFIHTHCPHRSAPPES